MSDKPRCDEIRELAPEAALGVISGEERARVLEHVTSCAECREHLDRLARTADELLRLAPPAEPPAGFEMRVLNALDRARRPRGAWALRLLAACLAGGLVVGVAAFVTTSSDRRLADHYRAALAIANGKYFDAASLEDPSDVEVGHVFAYEGTPSWVVVVLDRPSGAYHVTLRTDAETHPLGMMEAGGEASAWGTAIPVAVHDIEGVLVRPRAGAMAYHADF